ncbi:beta-D-glucosyl crocetin beta-1,6-glucosyltransferase-like [Ziziphus jujuba]|uniref:Glycosyltransferase n=1 Tax=Ziziphus jujuba TaxID=326968 RepID=A0ABM3IEX5_ZIZJJ|nr:beta-D-glucosyl crocetin beta-1,6-glucosyltransferase-like [Ziziphus jujuba]
MVDLSHRSLNVLMLPWLAHGHILPYLELAKKLTRRNFHIYFCSTPVNLNSIKPNLSSADSSSYSNSIQLVELHLPSFPELPPRYHTTKGLPPHLMPLLEKASNMSRPNITNIIRTLKPDLIIYDYHLRNWVPRLAFSLKIPAITFLTNGAALITFLYHYMKKKDEEFPFSELCKDDLKEKFVQMDLTSSSNNPSEQHEKGDGHHEDVEWKGPFSSMVLLKSFRDLEGKYMDYLYASFGIKMIPVGPLVPDLVNNDDNEGTDIINWLDKKEKWSTVFVSFGSECYLSKEDMEEMAHGLELSKVNFIWVIRFPEGDKVKLEDALPHGFLERVREKGMVVENWAPQLKILSHSSIGGFVSHCGWSSVMESIKFGVPIIAIPMQLDQPWNARVVISSGVGLEIEKRKNKRLIERENVAKVIREVMVEKTGEDVRRKVIKMSDNLKRQVEEEMDRVEKELTQICGI